DEPVVEFDLCCPQVRLRARAFAQLDEGVGLLRAGAQDSPRPVIFETAADEMHAIGQQGGSQRVPRMALIASPIEGEAERPGPIDGAALGQTVGLTAHGFGSPIW